MHQDALFLLVRVTSYESRQSDQNRARALKWALISKKIIAVRHRPPSTDHTAVAPAVGRSTLYGIVAIANL
jgi:hypothetical protein